MGKFVRISSNMFIKVYPGLFCKDTTPSNDAIPNRLNISVLWTDLGVLIQKGVAYYPAVIQDWDSVKSLSEREIITIGAESDNCGNDPKLQEIAEKMYKELEEGYKRVESNGVENPFKKKEAPVKTTTKKKEAPSTANQNLIDEE